ncbi:MAG: dTMP kinase [Aquificae bacterium]|nr:dTMP kinase [Aquificota bacterium]
MEAVFIAFEGVEGAGKSTQAEMLYRYFREKNLPAVLTKEPGGTETGKKIREILLSPTEENFPPVAELFLYEADRSFHVENVIKPNLKKGNTVITDRYIYSTLAYQGYARGLDLELVDSLNRIATAGLEPDITFIIDIPVEEGLKRIKRYRERDRIEREEIQFHRRLREGFLKIAQEKEKVYLIDGSKEQEEVFSQVLDILKKRHII